MNISRKFKRAASPAFLFWLAFSLCVSWYFHDRFWHGPDDGYFGYIGQQILDGKVPHKDIPVLHSGLIYFINTFFMEVSNGDLAGMRRPLIFVTIIQTGFAYKIAEKQGAIVASTAALASTSFSFVLFVNPTPNWYIPCLVLIVAYILQHQNARSSKTLILLGFIVGFAFLLSQLSGVILAIAVTTVVFLKESSPYCTKGISAGQIIILCLTMILALYVFKAARLTGLLVIGSLPLMVLFLSARMCTLSTNRSLIIISLLTTGALISASPLLIYYGISNSIGNWLDGMLIKPFGYLEQPLFQTPSYFVLPALSVKAMLNGDINGFGGLIYWLFIIFSPMALGLVLIKKMKDSPNHIPELGILASVFSLVAIHFEVFLYILYCSMPVFMGTLLSIRNEKIKKYYSITLAIVCSFSLYTHAGQSNDRGLSGIATNSRFDGPLSKIPNTSIIEAIEESKKYEKVLEIIESCSYKSDTIFAAPVNSEIYFLSKRSSPFNFFVNSIGLKTNEDLDKNAMILNSNEAPALIFHAVDDPSNTENVLKLMDEARLSYVMLGRFQEWEIYQHKSTASEHPCNDKI